MTLLILVILAVVWTVFLSSWWLQSRGEGRPSDSISSFRQQLSVLEQRTTETNAVGGGHVRSGYGDPYSAPAYPTGRGHGRPSTSTNSAMTRADARQRRRDVLFTLVAVAAVTLLAALVMGGSFVLLHLLIDGLVIAYLWMLIRSQRLAAERERKVRYLPRQPAEPVYQHQLRRTANQ